MGTPLEATTLALALPETIIVEPLIFDGYGTPVVVSIPKCETKEGISVLKIKTFLIFYFKYDL